MHNSLIRCTKLQNFSRGTAYWAGTIQARLKIMMTRVGAVVAGISPYTHIQGKGPDLLDSNAPPDQAVGAAREAKKRTYKAFFHRTRDND